MKWTLGVAWTTGLLACSNPGFAQPPDFGAERAAMAECFTLADAAFETQLAGDLDAELTGQLRTVAYNAASVCASLAFVICDPLEDSDVCFDAIAMDMQARRQAIVAILPVEIGDASENGFYVQYLPEFTPAMLPPRCSQDAVAETPGACFLAAEQHVALTLYLAWRMARVSGDAPHVGYDPVAVPQGMDGVQWYVSQVQALVADLPPAP